MSHKHDLVVMNNRGEIACHLQNGRKEKENSVKMIL